MYDIGKFNEPRLVKLKVIKDYWDEIKSNIVEDIDCSIVEYMQWIEPVEVGRLSSENLLTIWGNSDENECTDAFRDMLVDVLFDMFDEDFTVEYTLMEIDTEGELMIPTSLLDVCDRGDIEVDSLFVEYLLEDLRYNFDEDIEVIDEVYGSSVSRYELYVPQGVDIEKLCKRIEETSKKYLKFEVGTALRIVDGEKKQVMLDVPNKVTVPVCIHDLICSREFIFSKGDFICALGKDIGGATVTVDFDDITHMLIGGSDKSEIKNFMNSLIISLLYKSSIDDMRFIIIDNKEGDLSIYKDLPRPVTPIYSGAEQCETTLMNIYEELVRRGQLMREPYVSDGIKQYNDSIENNKGDRLPHIFVFVSELEEIMQVAGYRVKMKIGAILALGKMRGIHFIMASVNPDIDVFTGKFRERIPGRVAFKLPSAVESSTVIDEPGAEKLIGNGDMLFYSRSRNKTDRLQGAVVSDDEIIRVIDYFKNASVEKS